MGRRGVVVRVPGLSFTPPTAEESRHLTSRACQRGANALISYATPTTIEASIHFQCGAKDTRKIAESTLCHNQATRRHGQGDPSCLGPREPEHDDLASINIRDEDLFAVHTDCSNLTLQIDANSMQDVA